MRELNNIKIIAVDHGYGNIKTANTVTPTGVTAYETEPIFSGNILEYGGIYYRIGEGHKEFIADKAMYEDYYILTLPVFLAGCMAGLSQVPVAAVPVTQQEPDEDLDWDFLGE